MQLHVEKNPEQLSNVLAEWICNYINEVLKNQDRFTWALSGGNSPKQLYALLAHSPYLEKIPWNKLHIFFGDERDVPFDDTRNNGKMAYETLLKQVPVPTSQIHYMRTDLKVEESAAEYEKTLHSYFDQTEKSFDLVLLGMGTDGHTLSLFPGQEIIHEKKKWVTTLYVPAQQMYRLTLTPFPVNQAARIAFLVTGQEKARTLKKVLYGGYDPDSFPSQIIKPQHGELHWFVDEDAANLL